MILYNLLDNPGHMFYCHASTLIHTRDGGLPKISIFSEIISALPSWMFLGVCDDILINSKPVGVYPTARIAPDFSWFGTES